MAVLFEVVDSSNSVYISFCSFLSHRKLPQTLQLKKNQTQIICNLTVLQVRSLSKAQTAFLPRVSQG